jgi:exonuclease III
MKADIMVLTETWDNELTAKSRKKALWASNRIWSENSYDPNINRLRKGVSIVLSERAHRHLSYTEIPKNNNKDTGCLIKSLLSFRRNKIAIIGIYMPTNLQDKEDKKFVINKTIEWIRKCRNNNEHVILVGDLNEWIFENNKALNKLGKYIKRSSWLKEVWNQINPNIDGSTFPLKEPKHKIDYIYISKELIQSITQTVVSRSQTEIGEDHCSL